MLAGFTGLTLAASTVWIFVFSFSVFDNPMRETPIIAPGHINSGVGPTLQQLTETLKISYKDLREVFDA